MATESPAQFGARVKAAIEVERGGLGARALASTVGHLGGLSAGLPILGLNQHVNPVQWKGKNDSWLTTNIAEDDARAQELAAISKQLQKVRKQELGDHRVMLGGTNMLRDIPRILTNKRTSLLGKGLGLASYPMTALTMNMMRGSHYNPLTDTSYIYGNSPAVLTHELGHAIDFNATPVSKEKGIKGWLSRQGSGLNREAYMLARGLAPIMLLQEAAANMDSEDALRKAYKNDPKKLNQILSERQRELPAGFGSYLGGLASGVAGPLGPLIGMTAGKVYGLSQDTAQEGKYVNEKPTAKKLREKKAPKVEKQEERRKAAEFHEPTYNLGRLLFNNELVGPPQRLGLGYIGAGGLGLGLGGLLGAYNAEKGKKLRGALRGGLVGVGTGLGARAAGGAFFNGPFDNFINPQYPALAAALGGGFLGSAAGDVAADAVLGKTPENQPVAKKKKSPQKSAAQIKKTPAAKKKPAPSAARWFGPSALGSILAAKIVMRGMIESQRQNHTNDYSTSWQSDSDSNNYDYGGTEIQRWSPDAAY